MIVDAGKSGIIETLCKHGYVKKNERSSNMERFASESTRARADKAAAKREGVMFGLIVYIWHATGEGRWMSYRLPPAVDYDFVKDGSLEVRYSANHLRVFAPGMWRDVEIVALADENDILKWREKVG